jgi:dihydrofolate reductase
MSVTELDSFLQSEGARSVYVDGGDVVRQFIHERLLNELTITRIPVLIHSGTRLFEEELVVGQQTPADVWLELVESKSWSFGFTQDRWKLNKK